MASQTSSKQTFEDRGTEQFRVRMRPKAIALYATLFPGCEFVDYRANGERGHILDQEYAIDAELKSPIGCNFTLQEKFRTYEQLVKHGDFTQGWKTRFQTRDVGEGEWFHLNAAYYFYGWANPDESDFAQWILMNIPEYKLIVVRAGGLDKVGRQHPNRKHGQTAFYAIPLATLRPAIIAASNPLLVSERTDLNV